MKKLRIIAIIMMLVILSMQTAWAEECWLTSSGKIFHTVNTNFERNSPPPFDGNSTVKLDGNTFSYLIAKGGSAGSNSSYAVYKDLSTGNTITIGVSREFISLKDKQTRLKHAIHNHIKYIESIGGVMTGYKSHNTNFSGYVISWNVGDRHHYAKFCNSAFGIIGYYDLEFSNASNSEKYITQLNNTLSIY